VRRREAEARSTYLVERYGAGEAVGDLSDLARRVRSAAAADGRLRYLRSTIVPADEALLCLVEGSSADAVREALVEAGIPFDRISDALGEEALRTRSARPNPRPRRDRPC
jgi:hypothetical protein